LPKQPSSYLTKEKPIPKLRTLLQENYDISLAPCPPLQEKHSGQRNKGSYRLDVDTSIIWQRNPRLLLPSPITRVERRMCAPFPVDSAFVLAFSPHHIPAYLPCVCSDTPVCLGNCKVSTFAKMCKKYCHKGILLRLPGKDLYYQDDQYWVLTPQHYIQVENAEAAMAYASSTTTGVLWAFKDDAVPTFSLPNRLNITPSIWAKRFIESERPESSITFK
jgi:hypothetical protein